MGRNQTSCVQAPPLVYDVVWCFCFKFWVWLSCMAFLNIIKLIGARHGFEDRVQTSVPERKYGRVGFPTLGLLCHSTLKAKCECWSIFFVCIAAPMFFRHCSSFIPVIVSGQKYMKGTCLAPRYFVYCGRKGGHSFILKNNSKTNLLCKF